MSYWTLCGWWLTSSIFFKSFSRNILLTEGINNLTVVSVDAVGNQVFESYFVELDTTGPSVQIDSPTESLTNKVSQVVNASTDGINVELYFNDVSQGI